MAEPIYHLYKDENLNKEKLMQSKSFINDAASFLMKRENYEPKDLETNEEVYDAYMEHFRVQNVNEATALRDLNYAHRADNTDKKQFARLMDTYDRMDSDFGLNAMGDYLGGVFTAPSTYAGMFSFGATKVGAIVANQGIKLGIKQALKTAGFKSAVASAGIEAVGAGTTVYAQEKTRVQTGIKEEVDPFAVGLATTLAATVGGSFGLFTGTQRAMSSNKAQFIVNANKEVKEQLIKKTFKEASEKVFTADKTKQAATDFENELNLSIKVNELMDADSALSRGDAAAKAKEIIKKETPVKETVAPKVSVKMDAPTELFKELETKHNATWKVFNPKNIGGGKFVSGDFYVHSSAEDLLKKFDPSLDLKRIKENAFSPENIEKAVEKIKLEKNEIPDLKKYDIIKYNNKTKSISFIYSPNWNTAPEPSLSLSFNPNALTKIRNFVDPEKRFVYHHKWMFVKPSYQGFNYTDSVQRSVDWRNKFPDIKSDAIGTQSKWNVFSKQLVDKPYVRKTYTKDDIKNVVPNWFKEDPTVDVNIKVEDASKTAKTSKTGQGAITDSTYVSAETKFTTVNKKTLDYGAGGASGAKKIGADVYEPFVSPDKMAKKPDYVQTKDIASESYDRITNLNVLNVVKPEARDEIVKEIGRILKPKGEAIISTRGADVFGDTKNPTKAVLGDEPMSVITSMGTYQKGFKPDELLEYVSDVLGNGYSVKKIKLKENSKIPAIMITKKPQARLPLKETIPEALEKGAEVSKKLTTNIDQMEIKNIAAFASEIDEVIGDSVGILKGAERFTSRLVRALEGGVDSQRVLKSADLNRIMDKYGLDVSDLAPLLAHQVSEAASLMGKVSSLSKQGRKDAMTIYDNLNRGLNTIDEALKESGMGTATLAPRRVLEKQYGQEFMSAFGRGVAHISKARVGLMTIQVATTVRNTTNGYMRNYIYAMDNLGTGASNLVKGGSKYLVNFADNPTVKEEADTAVRLGIAQLKSSFDAFMLKDLHLGMTNGNTQALFRLLGDVKGKNKDVVATLLRGMGDISKTTGEERGLLGLARTFNTLNTMSDNLFKRAIFSREIDKLIRANPKRYTTKKIGAFDETGAVTVKKVDEDVIITSLDDLLKKGRYDMLDPEDISKAMNEAFEFTYQTGDFGMREGVANAFFKQLVSFGSSPLGSTVMPFPRYLVNQFRFAYSHSPILGMINIGGILNGAGRKAGKKGILGTDFIDIDVSPEAFGRQLGGLSLLGALYAIRVNHGDENTGPYEYIDPVSGDVMDARAMLGPYTAFALVADVLYREYPDIHGNTKVSDVKPYKSREIAEAVLGGLGRGGTGLWVVDSFVDSFQEEDSVKDYNIQKNIVKYLGNVFNTFFVGAGMLKDVAQQVDSSFLELPDNQDVDFFKYFLKQTFRSFPIAVDEDRPKLESPTRGSGRRAFNPIIKQFTGFTPREQRTVVENELSRLRFDYFETVPKSLKGDGPATNQMRGEMGRFMETDVFSYVNSDDYKNIDNDVLKRRNLKIVVNFYRAKARDHAINPDYAVTNRDFIDRQTNRYMDFSSSKRKEINEIYKDITQSERDIFKDGEMMMLPYLEELLNEQSPKLN